MSAIEHAPYFALTKGNYLGSLPDSVGTHFHKWLSQQAGEKYWFGQYNQIIDLFYNCS